MRVGVLFEGFRETHRTKDPGLLVEAFTKSGIPSVLVTTPKPGLRGMDIPLMLGSREEMQGPRFWQSSGLDFVIAFFWGDSKHLPVGAALDTAGIPFAIKMDSDGYVPSAFPREHLRRTLRPLRLRALFQVAIRLALAPWIDARVAKLFSIATALVIESPDAKTNLGHFLRQVHREDLVEKIIVIPNPVRTDESTNGRFANKSKSILCIGRWEDAAKNARNAALVIKRFLETHPDYEVVIVGTGDKKCKRILNPYSRARFLGAIPHADVMVEAQKAQILFMPSNWESFAYAAAEALTMGATLVGTPLPSFRYFTVGGEFGTLSDTFDRRAIFRALESEATLWDAGARQPEAIAAYWRNELNMDRIAGQYITDLNWATEIACRNQ